MDIFLWRKYFQENKYFFLFKFKIGITRPKMNILSSVFFAKILFLIAQKYSSLKIGCYRGSLGSRFIFLGS